MGATHKVVGAIGLVASVAIAVLIRPHAETLGADASVPPYTALWIYTPYVDPGDGVAVKVFLQGGDGVHLRELRASVDGAPAEIAGKSERARRSSRRYGMGKLDIELRAIVPPDIVPGEHRLALDLETECQGSSYSKACGPVRLEGRIEAGGAGASRVLSALRALLAALVVFFVARYGWTPLVRWLNAAKGGSAALLVPAVIVTAIVWASSSYPLFARPLGAAVGSASDALYGAAIVAWLVLVPIAVRTRSSAAAAQDPPSTAVVRLLAEDPEPESGEVAGYREKAQTKASPRRSLDEIAAALYAAHSVRYRRSGNRLVPRWYGGAPVTLAAEALEDAGSHLEMRGPYGYLIMFAAAFAAAFGPLALTVDGKTVRVERDDTAGAIASRLHVDPAPDG